MRRWFTGGTDASPEPSISTLDKARELQDAMASAAHMMNDEMELAEEELAKGNSSFHKLGIGLASFMRATLGFEKEFMKIACDRLALAEAASAEDLKKALRYSDPNKPSMYSPGTEYALCIATVQIMYAVVGMMTESLTEAIRGFYKLRKAYQTLERIIQEENKYLALHPNGLPTGTVNEPESLESSASELERSSGSSTEAPQVDTPLSEDSEEEFYDASEDYDGSRELHDYQGRLSSAATDLRPSLETLTITSDQTERPEKLRRLTSRFSDGPDAEIFAGNVIDGFIHSGASMCYGMLLVLVSLMPPSFSTLVKIAGFKGDRIRGISLLWRATKFQNINGIFASFVLLGYYNGLLGFIDILPSAGTGAYPRERCLELLNTSRQRYPKGGLWLLEEGRTLAREKKLEEAVNILDNIPSDGGLKQVRALIWFEKSMNYTYMHRDEEASESFLKLVEMNEWSHCLYYYMAGASLIESYRKLKETDPEKAQQHAEKAEELLKKAPLHIGKKKLIGRPLPLDVFINKKVQKWEQRSQEWSVPFADAVGVSPIEEMTYMWNGYKRMDEDQLNESYARLLWSESAANKAWSKEVVDEKANLGLLKAAIMRNKSEHDQAKTLLHSHVLYLQKSDLEGGLKDNWSLPIAHYEMSVINWEIYSVTNSTGDLEECSKWLEKAAHWGSYELDARYFVQRTETYTFRKLTLSIDWE